MNEPKSNAAILAITIALLLPQGDVRAQLTSRIEAGAVSTSSPGLLPTSSMSITPDLKYESPFFNVAARGSAWLSGQNWQFADGLVSGSVNTPTRHHLRAEITGDMSRAYYDPANQNDQIDAEARVHLVFSQSGGLWVSSGIARPLRVAVVSSVDVAGAGAWTQIGGATLTGTYTNFSFTKIASSRDSNGVAQSCAIVTGSAPDCLRQSRFSDVQGTVHWEKSFVEINAQTGYRFGSSADVTADSRRWASAMATLWMARDVAAVVGGGRQPANPSRGLPAHNYGDVGLMFSAWPAMTSGSVPIEVRASAISAFDVDPAGVSLQRVQVHIVGAEMVEVMGDFTEWQPVEMVSRGRGMWEALVPIGAGVHQINVRVDGGKWLAPPGTPTVNDGFSGKVGLLVVR